MLARKYDKNNRNNKSRRILIIICIVIAVIIVDTTIVKVSDLVRWRFIHDWKTILLFGGMLATYAVCYYLILQFIKRKEEEGLGFATGKKIPSAAIFRKVISIIQYIITAIIILVILQMVFYSQYSNAAITAVMIISYATATVMMGLLAYLFFRWFNQNRRSGGGLTVFLYGLSSAALLLNTMIGIALLYTLSIHKGLITGPRSATLTMNVSGPIDSTLNDLYIATSILGFILMWSATAILLRSHSRNLGKPRYWFSVSIPLVYFVSQFLTLFLDQLAPILALYPVLFTFLFIFSKPLGGILFGAAFYSIARSGTTTTTTAYHANIVRDYMILAAYGVVLFFVSSQNTIAQATYPPFGVIAASFVGLSAYMMFLGLYSSAISVSQDAKLRQIIRRAITQEAKFLESIGRAQMEQELQKKVLTIAKKNSDSMIEETGVQPSLSENDIKLYLEEVMKEIKPQNA